MFNFSDNRTGVGSLTRCTSLVKLHPGSVSKPGLKKSNVIVMSALMHDPYVRPVSASKPDGKSIEQTGS